jgi:hypothetical protein
MAPVEADWIAQMSAAGIDGKAALAELRSIARSYK